MLYPSLYLVSLVFLHRGKPACIEPKTPSIRRAFEFLADLEHAMRC